MLLVLLLLSPLLLPLLWLLSSRWHRPPYPCCSQSRHAGPRGGTRRCSAVCFGAFFFGSGHGGERRGVIRERQKTLPSSSSSLFSSSYPRHPGVRHNRRNAVSGVLGARDQGDTAPGGLFEEVAWAVRRRKVVVEVSFFYRSFFPFFPRRRRKSKVASGKKLTSCSAALRSSSVDFPENMGPVMISIRPTGGWSLPLSSSESFAPRQAEATIARCG